MSLSANSGATVVFDVPPADTGSPRNATNNDVTTSAATATRASTVRARTTGSYPVPGLSGASLGGTPGLGRRRTARITPSAIAMTTIPTIARNHGADQNAGD